MGVQVEGLIDVEEMLMILDTDAKRRSVGKLIDAGEKIQKIAIAMAPRDLGNLEHAIKMDPEPGSGRQRNELGQFVRTEVQVYIDMDMPVEDPHRKEDAVVGDYAYVAHEHITPMGPKGLGPNSIQKQLENPTVEVGGGFMTRAADMVEQDLADSIIEALNELF